jgi:hypothetical protein
VALLNPRSLSVCFGLGLVYHRPEFGIFILTLDFFAMIRIFYTFYFVTKRWQ